MMDVANIMPSDEVELTLQYSELLVPDQGVYELVYPTVVGPRYGGDPVASARDAEWVVNPYAKDRADGGSSALVETGIQVHLASPIPGQRPAFGTAQDRHELARRHAGRCRPRRL